MAVLDGDADLAKPARVSRTLGVERVEADGEHIGRRQAAQIRGAERRGAPISVVAGAPQIVIAEPVHGDDVERKALEPLAPGIVAGDEIRCRIDQELMAQPWPAVVASGEGNHGSKIAAGTVAADREPAGVDVEARALRRDPFGRGHRVLDRGGKFVLGGEPVTDGDDRAAARVGDQPADAVVSVKVADHPAAAMKIDERRQRRSARGAEPAVEAERDLPAGAKRLEIADLRDLRRIGLQYAPAGAVELARLGRRQRLVGRAAGLEDEVEHALGIGIEEGPVHHRVQSRMAEATASGWSSSARWPAPSMTRISVFAEIVSAKRPA